MSALDRDHTFELIRYSVPVTWSDQAVRKLVDRMIALERDPRIMPAGLTIEERRAWHIEHAP